MHARKRKKKDMTHILDLHFGNDRQLCLIYVPAHDIYERMLHDNFYHFESW